MQTGYFVDGLFIVQTVPRYAVLSHGGVKMRKATSVTASSADMQASVDVRRVHYALMRRNYAEIHTDSGDVFKVRITFHALEAALGEGFVCVKRGCLVSASEVYRVGKTIVLKSGESVNYVSRQKERVVADICAVRGCAPEEILERRVGAGRKQPVVSPAETAPVNKLRGVSHGGRILTVISDRKETHINIDSILYIKIEGGASCIHDFDGNLYRTKTTLNVLAEAVGEGFIRIHRNCLVSVMAIHSVGDRINLTNGETLESSERKRAEIRRTLAAKQKLFIDSLGEEGMALTEEEYREYYKSFENMPFAFTDIEMVFNDEQRAVDWIFRYGNEALARLEKVPLSKLIGSSFSSIFENMDSKWLRSYEQATLYGKTLELTDYSPEIDTYLKVICFPTFKGHCGCILFDLSEIGDASVREK